MSSHDGFRAPPSSLSPPGVAIVPSQGKESSGDHTFSHLEAVVVVSCGPTQTRKSLKGDEFPSTFSTPDDKKREMEAFAPEPQRYDNWKKSWSVVLGSWFLAIGCWGNVYTYGVHLPGLEVEFGQTKAVASLGGSVMAGCMLTFAAAAASLIKRIAQRRCAFLGGCLSVAAILGASFVQESFSLFVLLFGGLTGIGFSLVFLSAVSVVSLHFSKHRGIATGLALSGTTSGALIFAPIVESCIGRFGRSPAMRIQAAMSATFFLLGVLLCRVPSRQTPRSSSPGADSRKSTPWREAALLSLDLTLFSIRPYCVYSAAIFTSAIAFFLPMAYLPSVAKEEGLSAAEAAIPITVFGAFGIAGRIFVGPLSDSFGAPRSFTYAMLATTAVYCFLPFCTALWSMSLFAALYALCTGAYIALTPLVAADIAKSLDRIPTAMGYIYGFTGLGSFIGLPLAGIIAERHGYRIAFAVGALCVAVATLCAIVTWWDMTSMGYATFGSRGAKKATSPLGGKGSIRVVVKAETTEAEVSPIPTLPYHSADGDPSKATPSPPSVDGATCSDTKNVGEDGVESTQRCEDMQHPSSSPLPVETVASCTVKS